MVAEQLIPHGVTDERVLRVMSEIPREEFLTGRARRHAYEDRALAIGCGQTISQPLVVALMTQSLSLKPESIALEVGTGSGYQAAILSRLCRRVITIEREPALAEQASATLKRVGFDNVEFSQWTHPALTTVQQPTAEMASRAVEILFDQINEKSSSRKKAIYERLPCRLVIRQSCGANLLPDSK